MTNRVEELETQVAELRATVNALTEELVETKERVKQLEDSAEVEVTASDEDAEERTRSTGDVGAELVDGGHGGSSESAPSDANASDEEAKSTGGDDADEEGGSGADDSDIIVA